MSERPITKQELAEVLRHRIGKPPTKALPNDSFRDPIYSARMVTERIAHERQKMWKTEKRRAD